MSSGPSSRELVEDFLRYKLRSHGLTWSGRRAALRRRDAAAPPSSRRAERAITSHGGGVAQEETPPAVFSWCNDVTCLLLDDLLSPVDPGSAPPRLQVVLRRAGDELERCCHGDLSAHALVLLQSDGGGAARLRGLRAVREELFRDGVNWGRIVAMMELGGALCTEAARTGEAGQVDDIARWMEESLDSALLRGWIQDNGGWEQPKQKLILELKLSRLLESVVSELRLRRDEGKHSEESRET
ncbi:hypothetical protein L3Q82_004790 [Scortum barcoo]|uniref:Uncharacterized protein n=1 Tax=Scortum barcoo TaxID=214431 RepID=A0ACB8VH53_9TELE|nr:hypothetical protein L3Q82_004790 [Scortum barcoo]